MNKNNFFFFCTSTYIQLNSKFVQILISFGRYENTQRYGRSTAMCKVCFRPHYLTRLELSHFFVHTSILFFGFPPFLVSISYYYGFVSCRILFEEKQFLLRIFLYLELKNEISDK